MTCAILNFMKSSEFHQLAKNTTFAPRSIEVIKAVLVDKRSAPEVATEYQISEQRVYKLRNEFLQQVNWTPLDWLYHDIVPFMRRLGVATKHTEQIRAYIKTLK